MNIQFDSFPHRNKSIFKDVIVPNQIPQIFRLNLQASRSLHVGEEEAYRYGLQGTYEKFYRRFPFDLRQPCCHAEENP